MDTIMKKKLSVTIEKKYVDWVDKNIETLRFRNRSHALEFALAKLVESEKLKDSS